MRLQARRHELVLLLRHLLRDHATVPAAVSWAGTQHSASSSFSRGSTALLCNPASATAYGPTASSWDALRHMHASAHVSSALTAQQRTLLEHNSLTSVLADDNPANSSTSSARQQADGPAEGLSDTQLSTVAALQPELQRQLTAAHRAAAEGRLHSMLKALPPPTPESHSYPVQHDPSDAQQLMLLTEQQLASVVQECRLWVPTDSWQSTATDSTDTPTSAPDSKQLMAVMLARLVQQQRAEQQAASAARPSRPAADWSSVVAAEQLQAVGTVSQAVDNATDNSNRSVSRDMEALTQSLWEEEGLADRLQQHKVTVSSSEAAGAPTSSAAAPHDTGRSVPRSHKAPVDSRPVVLGPTHPYAPVPDDRLARQRVVRVVRQLLRKANFPFRDPGDPRATLLLRPAQLWEICEECGVTPSETATHADLATVVAGLVRHSRASGTQDLGRVAETVRNGHRGPMTWSDHLARQEGNMVTWEDAVPAPEDSQLQESALQVAVEAVGSVAESVAGEDLARTEAAVRKVVLRHLLTPHNVVGWLQAARAHDVAVITKTYPPPDNLQPPETASTLAAHRQQLQATQRILVVATATSDRHAAACAGAVRWQVVQILKSLVQDQRSHALIGSALEDVTLSHPQGTDPLSDWVSLDLGPNFQLHVLTQQARDYYRIEQRWMSEGSRKRVRGRGSVTSGALDASLSQGVQDQAPLVGVTCYRAHSTSQVLTLDSITTDNPSATDLQQTTTSTNALTSPENPAADTPTWDQLLQLGSAPEPGADDAERFQLNGLAGRGDQGSSGADRGVDFVGPRFDRPRKEWAQSGGIRNLQDRDRAVRTEDGSAGLGHSEGAERDGGQGRGRKAGGRGKGFGGIGSRKPLFTSKDE